MSKQSDQMHRERIASLRRAIRRAFPAIDYEGEITRHDGAWLPELTEENGMYDDEMFLYKAVKGHRWTDVAKDYLINAPDDFCLLSQKSLGAYLGAWLECSLDEIDGENRVREYLIYSFSRTGTSGLNSDIERVSELLSGLSAEQRHVLLELLKEFAQQEPSQYIREHAASAVDIVDNIDKK